MAITIIRIAPQGANCFPISNISAQPQQTKMTTMPSYPLSHHPMNLAQQTEGPYYPVVDFSDYDNNLNSAATDDETVMPILEDNTSSVEFTLFNLNEASGEDYLTIPNMNDRMVREFNQYRPYISILQF